VTAQDDTGADGSVQEDTLLGGRYRVKSRLGQGGMATVHLAFDERLKRNIVIKIPHAALIVDRGFRKRFTREVANLTRLEHPNIIRIYDYGEHEGIPFAVVQLLRGGDLADRVAAAGGRLSPAQVLEWLPLIARTLDHVHAEGFLHRDVSPGNIIFDEKGNPFLSDFGIATARDSTDPNETLQEDPALTRPGGFVGAASYAPPESIERNLTSRYDEYSLGVVVYQTLSGQLPFERGSSEAILVAKNTQPPRPLDEQVEGLPTGAVEAVMRALSKNPEDRFESCAAFAEAFEAGLGEPAADVGATAIRTEMVQLDVPGQRRRSWKPLGAVASILVLAVAGYLGWRWLPESPRGVLPGWTPVASTVTSEFRAGSTEAELADALSLCRRHMEDCEPSWFEGETLRVIDIGRIRVDPTEVTNSAFAAFAGAANYRTTAEERGYSADGLVIVRGTNMSWRAPTRQGDSHLSRPDHPVVHVSREDAMAYCKNQGKRLPTEDEWEFAARGNERHVFPWGDRWEESKANWGQRQGDSRPVGSFPAGDTLAGHRDLAGNVWEWTASDDGEHAVLKGGSWWDRNPANLRGAARLTEDPSYTSTDIGFRCVEDL